jgi:repressor LexA
VRPLTERQEQVLNYFESYYKEEGVPPTIQSVADHFGWKSPNAAQDHMSRLAKKGRLRKTNRGYVPV